MRIIFLWQVQYLVRLEVTPVAPLNVSDVSYVTRIRIFGEVGGWHLLLRAM